MRKKDKNRFRPCQDCSRVVDRQATGDDAAVCDNGRWYHKDCFELVQWRKKSPHGKASRKPGKIPYAKNGRVIRSTRGMT